MHIARRGEHEWWSAPGAPSRMLPRRFPRGGAALLLLAAALVLAGAAALRGTEYDENYSIFVTGGIARPAWPDHPFTPAEARTPFTLHADAAATARLLRETDVHPPLYFWALGLWRGIAGDALPALRGFSILLGLGALGAWMAAAWRLGAPPLLTGAIMLLSYGFAYTGHIARGFALPHLLVALAVLAAAAAARRPGSAAPLAAAAAGTAVGLASFANYLAIFPGAALLAWMVLALPGGWGARIGRAVAAGLPLLLLLGADMVFFLAQRGARPDQFEAFALLPALARLAQMNAASLLGGLPLYLPAGPARLAATAGLAALLGGAALLVALAWRRMETPARWLWLAGAAAPTLGLLALGAAFDNQPAELRYVAFGAPFLAALLAAAAQALPWRRLAVAGTALLLAVQAGAIAGMALHPATQQPFRAAVEAARPLLGSEALLLVPFGNDGVGVVGSLLQEAPAQQPVLVLRPADAADAPRRAAGFARLVLVAMGDRGAMAQAEQAAAALRADPAWRETGPLLRDHRGGYVLGFAAR